VTQRKVLPQIACVSYVQCGSPLLNLRVLLPESQLISKMDLREMGCEDGRWMELAQDRVQWRALMLAVLNLRVLLPESQLISKMDLREIGREDGKWRHSRWS
jgi:hypothetical protein